MRNLFLSLLLATTAVTPALAQPADRLQTREERQSPRPDRSQVRQERAQAREQARAERVQQVQIERAQERAAAVQSPVAAEARMRPGGLAVSQRARALAEQRQQQQRLARQGMIGNSAQVTGGTAVQRRLRQGEDFNQQRMRDGGRAVQRRMIAPSGARPDRPAPTPRVATGRTQHPEWRRDQWRHDRRYDWRRWRDHHRSTFRIGFYSDPFGWGYQRWGVGWRLWPSYYSSSYWLNDPFQYRLPYAPWPYRWVRYYNDALLVNTISGQVVDVEYDFFW